MPKNNQKFNATDYKSQYNKDNYTQCIVRLKSTESEILTEYSQNLGLSKNALLLKCLVYCYDNMIDVSNVKLSTVDKSAHNKD